MKKQLNFLLYTTVVLVAVLMIIETHGDCDEENADSNTGVGKRQIKPTGVFDKLVSAVSDGMKRNLEKYWRDSETRYRREME